MLRTIVFGRKLSRIVFGSRVSRIVNVLYDNLLVQAKQDSQCLVR